MLYIYIRQMPVSIQPNFQNPFWSIIIKGHSGSHWKLMQPEQTSVQTRQHEEPGSNQEVKLASSFIYR